MNVLAPIAYVKSDLPRVNTSPEEIRCSAFLRLVECIYIECEKLQSIFWEL